MRFLHAGAFDPGAPAVAYQIGEPKLLVILEVSSEEYDELADVQQGARVHTFCVEHGTPRKTARSQHEEMGPLRAQIRQHLRLTPMTSLALATVLNKSPRTVAAIMRHMPECYLRKFVWHIRAVKRK